MLPEYGTVTKTRIFIKIWIRSNAEARYPGSKSGINSRDQIWNIRYEEFV